MNISKELLKLNKRHEPSYARGLVRLAKAALADSADMTKIIDAVRNLKDPYYSAYALSDIAKVLFKRGKNGHKTLFNEALGYAGSVKQDWRQAEIISKIAADMGGCGITDFSKAEILADQLSEEKPRSEAFREIAGEMAKAKGKFAFTLLRHARDRKEMWMILKNITGEALKHKSADLSELAREIQAVNDPYMRSKGLAYLGMKAYSMHIPEAHDYFYMAIKSSESVEDQALMLELMLDIAYKAISSGTQDISNIVKASDNLPNEHRAIFLTHTARKLLKHGSKGYEDLFEMAHSSARQIESPGKRYKVLVSIADGVKEAELKGYEEIQAEADSLKEKLREDSMTSMSNKTALEETPAGQGKSRESGDVRGRTKTTPGYKRVVTLGLYSTYEKKLSSAHVRAVARAAPLCYAFGLNLCLFGFPFRDEKEAQERVGRDTSVGKGGYYLDLLLKENRFEVRGDIHSREHGIMIATTSHPDGKKSIVLKELDKKNNLCFLLGVGKTGLPKSVLSLARYHLEFSGQNIPFETSTAMGILAYMLKDI